MLANTHSLLKTARKHGYAVGSFNIYNLEGAAAVVRAAEEMVSPVILQILPSALEIGGKPLVSLCLEMAASASVPVSVHLDHCNCRETIYFALDCGISSVMADGSDLDFEENITFTQDIVSVSKTRYCNGSVEAELGKLSGEEDGRLIDSHEASMTSADQAKLFVEKTNIDALAVCIGNIHGNYHTPPHLDFDRLAAIAEVVSIPLVLHGTSGLPDEMITESIKQGVCKFNVNTEVRRIYLDTLREEFAQSPKVVLVQLMKKSIEAMKEPVRSKIKLFCSAGRA